MSGTPKTLGLCFIAKTQTQADDMKLWGDFFDELYYEVGTVTDFAKARNKVLAKVTTDYWMWLDTDDEVSDLASLRRLVDDMDQNGIDALYLPYEYAHNEYGEVTLLQWRERILRTSHPFSWKGAVHETLISSQSPMLDRSEEIVIVHQDTDEHMARSNARNHKILLREYKKDKDPRTIYYLAMSYFGQKDFQEAIKLYGEHIESSGWDEERYRSWFYVSQAYQMLKMPQRALEAASRGVLELPNRPEMYVALADASMDLDRYKDVLEWLSVAGTKPAPTGTLSPVDPTYYGYRAEMLAALAYLYLGRTEEAWQQINLVLKHSPKFKLANDLLPTFETAYFENKAIKWTKLLVSYLKEQGGQPEKVLQALPRKLLLDIRLNELRNTILPPKQWPEKSIVFLTAGSPEPWGPEYLDRGMGGSEEAVIYLSRELAKLGWQVTVYNEREGEHIDGEVQYLPNSSFNPLDEFDVIVAWRYPQFFKHYDIKARVKAVDLHDAPVGHQDIPEDAVKTVDKFFFKSNFQRSVATHIPDEKIVIAPNGIVPKQFNQQFIDRNPLKVVYGSSPDRGLGLLLKLWPRVKEQVPEAELHIYYGWNTFDSFHYKNPERMKWKWQLIREMHRAGVTDHGRINHQELAEEYLSAGVWAYPTEFPEISCITAMKAGAAGLISVTSGFAALAETVLDDQGPVSDTDDIYTNKNRQDSFVQLLVQVLKFPDSEGAREIRSIVYKKAYSWESVAKKWDENLV